jgi:hypothetical protein
MRIARFIHSAYGTPLKTRRPVSGDELMTEGGDRGPRRRDGVITPSRTRGGE